MDFSEKRKLFEEKRNLKQNDRKKYIMHQHQWIEEDYQICLLLLLSLQFKITIGQSQGKTKQTEQFIRILSLQQEGKEKIDVDKFLKNRRENLKKQTSNDPEMKEKKKESEYNNHRIIINYLEDIIRELPGGEISNNFETKNGINGQFYCSSDGFRFDETDGYEMAHMIRKYMLDKLEKEINERGKQGGKGIEVSFEIKELFDYYFSIYN